MVINAIDNSIYSATVNDQLLTSSLGLEQFYNSFNTTYVAAVGVALLAASGKE